MTMRPAPLVGGARRILEGYASEQGRTQCIYTAYVAPRGRKAKASHTYRRTDGRMDGWTDGRTHALIESLHLD